MQDGQLGRVSELGAGVPGLIVAMATSPTGHAFGAAVKYASFESLPTELQAIEALDLFYQEAPNRPIYVMPVPDTVAIADIVDVNHAQAYAKKLCDASDDIWYFAIAGKVLAHADVTAALTKAQALAESRATLNVPVIPILAATYNAALPDLTSATFNRCACLLSYDGAEVGLLLGRKATNPVQRNVGRVKDGALSAIDLTIDGTALIEDSLDKVTDAHDKGYVTIRTIKGKTGYYFTHDPMAVAETSDYARIGLRSVIDKAHRIAYGVYIEELNDDVAIDADGKLSASVVKSLQGAIEDDINAQMTANDEISSVSAYIDETQDVLATDKLTVVLKIVPKGNLGAIEVELGFSNPAT